MNLLGLVKEIAALEARLGSPPHWQLSLHTRPLDREGGLREFDILSGRGFISFLAVPRHHCIYVCNITWYG
ncbi:hypothetical protein [Streptomyces sp. ME19-01-6]|uniref:hypothetical protein n=1 Tax=Streptomyces sp. ME19-01-6 TaxID=3028686 RepID=UPI0029B4C3EA|nr:hypothetical protein [Streptomyces sp. ME19-01-6]MDX3227628.1 hypothetical protein [Streptomyces sp. ME19-01-6]